MRYSDLRLNFDIPFVWKSDGKPVGEGLSFGENWLIEKQFVKMKTTLREELCKGIASCIDDARTEIEIGANLDPYIDRLSKSYFCSNEVNEDLLLKKANKNTLQKKLQGWTYQLIQNISFVRKTPGIKIFFDKFRNIPCVIVAAGPNLKNSIEKLRGLKGKAMIMAVDTSFRPLMKREIFPDFCNAHDANENGQKFFQGVKTDTVGIFVNYIHPKTIASYGGQLCFYYVDDESIASYKLMAIACDAPDRPDGTFLDSKVTGGSSVAHTAMYIAIEMGCNPITFVGLDLSYPDLNNSHFESDNPKDIKSQKLIDVMDIRGRKVKTNLSFMSYKSVMEKMCPLVSIIKNVRLFTSTEDEKGELYSVIHAGLEPIKFEEWAERYAKNERQELKQIGEIYNNVKNI